MKRFICSLLILLSVTGFSQDKITGALGLTFGISKETAKNIILKQGGVFMPVDDNNQLSAQNISEGEMNPRFIVCFFHNDSLGMISLYFYDNDKGFKMLRLSDTFSSKYGEPTMNISSKFKGWDVEDNSITLALIAEPKNYNILLIYSNDKLAKRITDKLKLEDLKF
jgi:hypothetical protein